MVKTASFHCRGHGFDPGQGTKILYTVQPKKKKKFTNYNFQPIDFFSLKITFLNNESIQLMHNFFFIASYSLL